MESVLAPTFRDPCGKKTEDQSIMYHIYEIKTTDTKCTQALVFNAEDKMGKYSGRCAIPHPVSCLTRAFVQCSASFKETTN